MNETTVRVDHCVGGRWEIALSDQPEPIVCETLEEAGRVAYRCATDRRPCELVMCDAYHRVLRREMINISAGPSSRAASQASRLS